jgi:hypothetical protein
VSHVLKRQKVAALRRQRWWGALALIVAAYTLGCTAGDKRDHPAVDVGHSALSSDSLIAEPVPDTNQPASSEPLDSADLEVPAPTMPAGQTGGDSVYRMFFRATESREVAPRVRCHHYDRYVVVEWESPDPEPVAIVRERAPGAPVAVADCTTDSLAGDFVLRNEWAEYYSGLWEDLLLLDSGTGQLRDLILYDVPSRKKLLTLEGAGEMAGVIDSTTVRIWLLSGAELPRSLCPEIPDMFDVGVDSLFAFDLRTLQLTSLGEWRCHQLQ